MLAACWAGIFQLPLVASPLLQGAIEFHVHSSPDIIPRSTNDIALARAAKKAGMRAVVLKNHAASTAARAVLASQQVPGIEVFGGVVLNKSVGGINPEAVVAMAQMGGGRGKVVWLPTVDAVHHRRTFDLPGQGISLGKGDRLLPEVEEVLQIVARQDLVLETGHISPSEAISVIARAEELGVERILVTHPMASVPEMSLAEMQKCTDLGAFLELDFVNSLMGEESKIAAHHRWQRVSIEEMVAAIRAIGAEHFVLSTDLGRVLDPLPVDGYESFIGELLAAGIREQEIDLMARKNPAFLLGL